MTLAAGLACGASASFAGVATLNITGFSATANTLDTFVFAVGSTQSYAMTALRGSGLGGSATNNYSANDWNLGPNRTASVPYATATGNTVQFTDNLTALATAGFDLSGTSVVGGINPPGALRNSANATAQQTGAFVLVDGNGDQIAGSITFDIFYDLGVSNLFGGLPTDYAQSLISLLASGGGSANLSDSLFSFSSVGGVGAKSGHFSWTANLGAADTASYTLSGTAFASSQVPEPSVLALVSLALLGMVGVSRKRSPVDAAAA